jgi:hypothetical protein
MFKISIVETYTAEAGAGRRVSSSLHRRGRTGVEDGWGTAGQAEGISPNVTVIGEGKNTLFKLMREETKFCCGNVLTKACGEAAASCFSISSRKSGRCWSKGLPPAVAALAIRAANDDRAPGSLAFPPVGDFIGLRTTLSKTFIASQPEIATEWLRELSTCVTPGH